MNGSGTLNVADGGQVTTSTLYASLGDLYGNGSITATQGAVLDADLRFDASHRSTLVFPFGSGGTLSVTASGGDLGAGYKGRGSLTIADGVSISCGYGRLGYYSGATGVATITGTGSKWTNSGDLDVGMNGSGTLNVADGGQVSNVNGYLGGSSGATCVATITGAGSQWANSGSLFIAYSGSSTLNVASGGQVSSGGGALGYYSGGLGVATITGSGSKWINSGSLLIGWSGSGSLTVAEGGQVTTTTLYASLGDLYGNGSIAATQGAVLDADLRFDASHRSTLVFPFGSGGTLTVTASGGDLGAGYKGRGSLTIADGVSISCGYGRLGYYSGATGVATITGSGSKWTNSGSLYVGYSGSGTLDVADGGQASSFNGYLGYNTGATGVATISGSGSIWSNSGGLYVGNSGTLQVSDGGQVTAGTVLVIAQSLFDIDVDNGSALSVGGGTGTITNNGNTRFTAAAGAAAGQYRPISATTFTGSGAYTAIGGTWDPTGHVFTVSSQMMAASGTPVTLDLASQQRLLVSDSQSGWSVGASLLAKTGSVNFTATAMPDSNLGALTLLDGGESLLGAWQFSLGGSGYSLGDPVYLSFPVADGTPLSELQVWHWDGTGWSAFAAGDLNESQGYASFTVTSFSGYAVSVPEPSTLALLGMGTLGLLAYAWRRRRKT